MLKDILEVVNLTRSVGRLPDLQVEVGDEEGVREDESGAGQPDEREEEPHGERGPGGGAHQLAVPALLSIQQDGTTQLTSQH